MPKLAKCFFPMLCLLSGAAMADCELNVVVFLQNELLKTAENIENNGCSIAPGFAIGGSVLGASSGISLNEFNLLSDEDLKDKLERFLDRIDVDREYDGWVLLDIEHPVHFRKLSEHSLKNEWSGFQEAYQRRVRTVRLALPKAMLVQYGVFAPSSKCSREYDVPGAVSGLHYAYRAGLFKNLDYVAPVLYLRNSAREEGIITSLRCQMKTYTKYINEFREHDFGALRNLPLLSAAIYSRKSVDDRMLITDDEADRNLDLLVQQVDLIKTSEHRNIGIWSASDGKNTDGAGIGRVHSIAFHLISAAND